jgi:hypothetical protein
MKKRLNLAMAIFLTILTTATILLFFYGVSYSKDALGYVTLISTAGYLAAGLYYHNYMEIKKQEDISKKIMIRNKIWDDAFNQGYNQGWLEYKKTDGGKISEEEHIKTFNNLQKHLDKMIVTKKFYREDGRWYIALPEFLEAGLGNKNNLLMVDGADTLLDILAGNKPHESKDGTEVDVTFGNEPFDGYTHTLNKKTMGKNQPLLDLLGHAAVEYGAYYDVKELDNHQVWLCPVTEYVFNGEYPDTIYLKKKLRFNLSKNIG